MEKKTVCVIGLGYIGLPTAALLANHGHRVVGVDLNQRAVDTINQGQIHIVEPDLDAFVRSAVAAGRLKAFTEPQPADIYMICVPTPFHPGGPVPRPNIDHVLAATRGIAHLLKPGDMVILESTSPVGTTRSICEVLAAAGVDVGALQVAYCPERVLPGKIMTELVENDRVVGGFTPAATAAVSAFYRTFVHSEVLETDAPTAEMCKLAENSYRDVNIAFANELSLLCASNGINVWRLIELANRHPRVQILQPGVGVGGHCIAVDPWFLVASDPAAARLIRTGREVNNYKTDWCVEQIKLAAARLGKLPSATKVACFGLAFKPDIDDLRESPAMHVAKALLAAGYEVSAVEPNITSHPEIPLVDAEAALARCDLAVLLVKHRDFVHRARSGGFGGANVLDLCGLYA